MSLSPVLPRMSSLKTLLDQAAAVECPPEIRNRIMEGALICVKRWGIDKTSLNDIAREAGCARQTVYNYYGSRDGVVLAALLESSRQFAERLQTHRHADAFAAVPRHRVCHLVADDGGESRLILSDRKNPCVDDHLTSWQAERVLLVVIH